MKNEAKLVGVAILHQGEMHSLPAPARHCDVFRILGSLGKLDKPWKGDMHYDQGFVDEDGFYLNRYQAKARALRIGQITSTISNIMTSEDLW